MKTELENDYDALEQEAEELDAGSPAQDSDDDAGAYDEFVADRRTLRYEDTPANRRKLFDYLLRYRPALPESSAALYLAFDELRKDDKLELIPLAPEKSPCMRTAGEVQAEEAERAEPDPTQNETAKSANAMPKMFRKGSFARYKNGRKVGAQVS
jgi:hypothetical protein